MQLLPIPVLLAAATALQAQALLTVDDDGPADFAEIQAAIDAAPEGATILVRAGIYDVFSVVDKALVVTAEQGASVRAHGTTSVADLAAGKTLVLSGLELVNSNFADALIIRDCSGTVWIENSTIGGPGVHFFGGTTSLRIETSSVVLSRTTVSALRSLYATLPPPLALHASGSSVHLFESSVVGGTGAGDLMSSGLGGTAVLLEGGFLFAASSTLRGGQGGPAGSFFGCAGQTSGQGGKGLVLAADAQAHVLGGTLAGGPGGMAFGTCAVGPVGPASEVVAGALAAVPWPAHGLAVASPVHESEGAQASLSGPPGEFAWYLFSDTAQALFLPQVLGTLVLDFPLFLVPVGALDAGGQAQVTLTPALAPGAHSQSFLLQSLFLDAGTGAFTLSSPASLVVLADGS